MKKYTLKNYADYIKKNPNKLWFKMKLYGWGWVPVSWQGWTIVLSFILIILLNGSYLSYKASLDGISTSQDLFLFFAVIIISIILLIWICYKKGERPKWNWGRN